MGTHKDKGPEASGKTNHSGPETDTDELSQRINRYGRAKVRGEQMSNYLLDLKNDTSKTDFEKARIHKLQSLVSSCGNYLHFSHYYTEGETRLTSASFCRKHLLCPLCAIRRGAKTLNSYLRKFEVIRAAEPDIKFSMITLTVRNGPDLGERFAHLQSSVKVLLQRRRDWLKKGRGKTEWRKVSAFVGSYELTNKGKGWHPHAHVLVLHRSLFDYSALVAEWKEVTGDSIFVNVAPGQHPENPAQDFLEVFKYAVKFSDLSLSDNYYAFEVLSGKRMLFSGGDFRAVKFDEDDESLLDKALDDLPYIELFYKFSGDSYWLRDAIKREATTGATAAAS